VNAVSSTETARAEALRRDPRALSARLIASIPLVSVYVWLCVVYLVEAWARLTPWLFTDELEMTQLSRSIADTGHPAERGQRMSPHSLYTVVTAPLWLIHHVETAYAGVKDLNVLVMASVVFPTYFLARLLVARGPALFAAAGAGVIPSLAYTSYIVEENLAYPYAALCFFLIAKGVLALRVGAGRRWPIAAVVASAIAPAVRGELVVIPIVAALALVFGAWSSDWARRRRRSWSIGDWAGTVVLAFGGIFVISGFASNHSYPWLVATRGEQHRMLNMGNWAAGALAIGIGVVPFVGGLAALVRSRGEPRSPELSAVRSVALAGVIGFAGYTSIKAAYLSTQFATRVEERNLIYIAPLLFVGTALLIDRRRVNLWALLGAAAFATYLVGYALYHPTQFPYEMNVQLYSDALGLAILQQANRYLFWTPDTARWVLIGIVTGGTLALAALPRLRARGRLAGALAAALAVSVVGWSLTGEISAAAGSNSIGRAFKTTLSPTGQPLSWVDAATQGKPTLYMGEGEKDQISEWLLEFWNRSIVAVSSLDGTVEGPGPSGGPNLAADGTLYWTGDPVNPGPQYDYAVEDPPCIDLAGTVAGSHLHRAGGQLRRWLLVRLTHPNRLRAMCTGIYPDGWTGATDSAYFRFSGSPRGWLRVIVSRRDWGGPTGPSPVHVLVGKLVINDNDQPILGKIGWQRNLTIDSTQTKTVWVPAPGPRFAVHVVIDKKFVPDDYNHLGDVRALGAEVSYRFFRTLPRGAKPASASG
jgi:hypothetical protein